MSPKKSQNKIDMFSLRTKGLIILEKIKSSNLLRFSLTIISFIYPLALMFLSWQEITEIDKIQFSTIILLAVLYLISFLLQLINWLLILRQSLKKKYFDIKIYLKTILMQRLPGGFWHWVGRVNLYTGSKEVKTNTAIDASVFERVALILTGFSTYILVNNTLLGILSFSVILVLFYFWRRSKNKSSLHKILYPTINIMLYLICWLLAGAILFYVINSIDNISNIPLTKSISIWALTGSISLVFFFLPGGIGVKEISLTTLLIPYTSFAQAILVAFALRMLALIMDLLISILGLLIINLISKYNKDPLKNGL